MRPVIIVLVLLVFVAAGCLSTPPSSTEEKVRSNRAPVVKSAPPQEGALPKVEQTSFSWSATKLTGDIAVMFSIVTEARCDLYTNISYAPRGYGPGRLILNHRVGGGVGWASASQSPAAHAHVLDLADTRDEGTDGRSGGRTRSGWTGPSNVTIAARNVVPYEGGDFLPAGHRLGFDVRCQGPVEVTGFRESREFLLFSATTMDGGIGASASVAAALSFQDRVTRSVVAERGDVFVGGFGSQAGQIHIAYPSGARDCNFNPTASIPNCFVQGGPGDYSIDLTRLSAGSDVLVGLIAGSDPVDGVESIDRPGPVTP